MSKIKILLFTVVTLIVFTECKNMTATSLDQADSRAKTISALMNNDDYMKEVMDSMQMRHGGNMPAMAMGKGDMIMDENMMDQMMEKCKTDSTMYKMMMDKTMAMWDSDAAMCKMMMASMKQKPNVMKEIHAMCDMKTMKMDKKK